MPIPDRWMQYKPYGSVIKGTKIIAFKVPLEFSVVKGLIPEDQFTTALLMDKFPDLKFVIDLTNTSRYYDGKQFTAAGVQYHKIMVAGKKVPSIASVKQFFKVMDNFLASAKENEIIGVHCTHGLNRTGYLVCRYLVQQLGWDLVDAVKEFQEARGYPIERGEYIKDLESIPRDEKLDTSDIVLLPSKNNYHKRREERFVPDYSRTRGARRNLPNNWREPHREPGIKRRFPMHYPGAPDTRGIVPFDPIMRGPLPPRPWQLPRPMFEEIPRPLPPFVPPHHSGVVPCPLPHSLMPSPPRMGPPLIPSFPPRHRPPRIPPPITNHQDFSYHQTRRNEPHRHDKNDKLHTFNRRIVDGTPNPAVYHQNDFVADTFESNFCDEFGRNRKRKRPS